VFLHPVGSTGHIVRYVASGEQNVDALFFMLRWDQYGFDKKCAGTPYDDLMFLHPVGFVCHVVHSGAAGALNVNKLFSCRGGRV
jgi:hypothetical protein